MAPLLNSVTFVPHPARLHTLSACLLCLGLIACTDQHVDSTNEPNAVATTAPEIAPSRHDIQRGTLGVVDAPVPVFRTADVATAKAHAPGSVERNALISPDASLMEHGGISPTGRHSRQIDINPVKRAADTPVSTFALDVDTGSYALVRRHINHGQLPPAAVVRTEEMINYFTPSTLPERDNAHPLTLSTELTTSPWHSERALLRISVDSTPIERARHKPANLVFLVDVSGSMNAPDKLPLLKSALRLLSQNLNHADRVSIVTYAGHTAVALEPTAGDDTATLHTAIDALGAGGGTHGSAGLRAAYALAQSAYIEGGINRVLLATDGDFNLGETNHDTLVSLIESKRKTGIALSTLGFGQGNYNDHLIEQLADHGNGNYTYIDTLREAKRVLVSMLNATLDTVAYDAKIQVEFNPATVAEYRLIGYENRLLHEQDFNNDRIDAGDIGAGHSVTALYEVALVGSDGTQMPARRFAQPATQTYRDTQSLADVKLRYKRTATSASERLSNVITTEDHHTTPSDRTSFAASVAAWADWLRSGDISPAFGPDAILKLASAAMDSRTSSLKREFLELVSLSESLRGTSARRRDAEAQVNGVG